MRTCTRCEEEKPFELFSKRKASRDGLHHYCKTCASEYHKEWYARNRERIQEKSREYARSHPEYNRSKTAKWVKDNPERAKEGWKKSKERRREREKTAKVKTRVDRKGVWEKQNGKCGICGELIDMAVKHPDPKSRSIDHIVALSKGGLHTEENIQFTHFQCNLYKGVS